MRTPLSTRPNHYSKGGGGLSTASSSAARLRPGDLMAALLLPWKRWRRRVSTVNLLCMFLVCFVLVTAYLHGLIEVDSNRVVINIAAASSSGTGGSGSVVGGRYRHRGRGGLSQRDNSDLYLVKSAGESSLDKHGPIENANLIAHDDEDDAVMKKKSAGGSDDNDYHPKVATPSDYQKTTSQKYDYLSHDKNITNLFLIMERNRPIIMSTLSQIELDDLLRLKRDMLIALGLNGEGANEDGSNDEPPAAGAMPPPPPHADIVTHMFALNSNDTQQQQQQQRREAEQLKSAAAAAAAAAEQAQIGGSGVDSVAAFRPITRDLMIKFLKLEKFHLQKMKSSTRTVRDLLDEFIAQNDINRDELPEIWYKYFVNISELQLYNNSQVLNEILHRMSTIPVNNCYEKEKGTQIKLLLSLDDGTNVLVKPMKVPRDYETPPDHFYFVDFERHHAEIAAFHVDRLLGFYRVPPTVGRVFNMSADLWEKAEEELAKTFFYSPAGNVCFTGHCSYYCDTTHAICGRPHDRMEGSVQLMLPSKPFIKWQVFNHPYRRTYTKRKKALWEVDDTYCEVKLLQDVNYASKLILDLMDMSVFDFLTGNMDRHHYEKMTSLGNDTFMLHLDNGRSFGKANHDEMSILAPVRQCCLMRYSTYERLRQLYANKFSRVLDASLRADPLYPILTEAHLRAVDRRLDAIFYQLIECMRRYKPFEVIVDDGY